MGGVDLFYQAVNTKRISIQEENGGSHVLIAAEVNSWKLQIEFLEAFYREIVQYCFRISTYPRKHTSGSVRDSLLGDEGDHFPKKLKKHLRCHVCH